MKLKLGWPRTKAEAGAVPKVATMGALRSGTNLVAGLLEKYWHLSTDFHAYGWKHAGVPVLAPTSALKYPETPIIWVCKNPHALMVSLHRYLMQAPNGRGISLDGARDFAEFLRRPITIWDSRLKGSPRLRFGNPVQYWNFITWNLETLDSERFRVLGFNYEDVLADPQILAQVDQVLKLERREPGPIVLPTAPMARGRKKAAGGVGGFDVTAYTSQSYLASFTPDDLAFVAGQVDPWLMERRGYTLP